MAEPSARPAPSTPLAWAAPDARPDEPPARVVPVAPPTPGAAEPGRGRPELPVPLRPMSVGDRIDGALRILKLAPGTVATLAAVTVVPIQLVAAVTLRGQPGLGDGDDQLVAVFGRALVSVFVDDTAAEVGLAVVLVLLEVLAVSLVAAGMTYLLTGWYVGRQRSTAEVLAETGRRLPAVAAAWFLVHLAELAFGLALLVPALVPMTWFALAAPVIGAEGHGPWRALARSYSLAKRAFATVLGTCLLVALVDVMLRFALTTLGMLYVDTGWPGGWAVATAVSIAARLLTVPFVAGCAALQYLDLRVRLEGLDIELAAVERLPVAG